GPGGGAGRGGGGRDYRCSGRREGRGGPPRGGAGARPDDRVNPAAGGGIGRVVLDHAAGLGGGQLGQRGIVGIHRRLLRSLVAAARACPAPAGWLSFAAPREPSACIPRTRGAPLRWGLRTS